MLIPVLKKVLAPRRRLALRMLFWKVRGWVYRGSRKYCPLCEHSFRTFLPFGKPTRLQALCPHCHTVERHRLLWHYLVEEIQVQTTGYRVLHMAPEPVIQEKLRRLPHLHYLSADLVSPVAMDKVDIQELPYAPAQFDLILCSHVLGHVPDDRQGLRELRRVLAPHGCLLLQDHVSLAFPITEELLSLTPVQRYTLFGQADRLRNYGQDFVKRVEAEGFIVETVDFATRFSTEEQQRLGLGHQECLYLARPVTSLPYAE